MLSRKYGIDIRLDQGFPDWALPPLGGRYYKAPETSTKC